MDPKFIDDFLKNFNPDMLNQLLSGLKINSAPEIPSLFKKVSKREWTKFITYKPDVKIESQIEELAEPEQHSRFSLLQIGTYVYKMSAEGEALPNSRYTISVGQFTENFTIKYDKNLIFESLELLEKFLRQEFAKVNQNDHCPIM